MRILCLHPAASSALQFSRDFHKLEERLWTKHGIELVFVDGPLLDARVGNPVGERDGGIRAVETGDDGEQRASRRWYVADPSPRETTLPQSAGASRPPSPPPAVRYSGLDASLLHLSQIWSRGGANTSNNLGECFPFQGVLGIGQGADVAGLLPLLNYHEDNEGDGSDDEKENVNDDEMAHKRTMFAGLRFVILIDGEDILFQQKNEPKGTGDADEENDFYVGPDGVKSLHVIMDQDGNDRARRSSGEKLARHYGPNAKIHRCNQTETCTPALSNILGKFLVARKNELRSDPKSRELISLQGQLAAVEQLATLAIAREVQKNPPKALMAVIGPAAVMPGALSKDEASPEEGGEGKDREGGEVTGGVKVDRAVGAWHGARRRGFGEEGGGAPCPGEFLLREDRRGDS